jgi:hypothetical protein
MVAEAIKTHGMGSSVIYQIWHGMIKRCTNKEREDYANYGGRGITVCERWLGESGLANFHADMGERPSDEHTLERIDNNKGYSPENCRWATHFEQNRNQRTNLRITAFGQSMIAADWCLLYGAHRSSLGRLLRKGKTPEEAIIALKNRR